MPQKVKQLPLASGIRTKSNTGQLERVTEFVYLRGLLTFGYVILT